MDTATLAVLIRGWQVTPESATIIHELLGDEAQRETLAGADGVWRNADPVGPDEPVGRPATLVCFTAATPAGVDIVPGSQGVEQPPGDPGVGLVRIEVGPGRQVVLDGRCWFRTADPAVRIGLWQRKPGRR